MTFHSLTLADRARLAPVLAEANRDIRIRDFSFFSLYMWAEICEVELAEENGLFYIRSYDDMLAGPIYALPHRGDALIAAARRLTELHPSGFTVRSITPETRATLASAFGNALRFESYAAESDYLYRLDELFELRGRKFATKRNHIHALLRDHESVAYEPITAENLGDARALHLLFRETGEDEGEEARLEGEAVFRIFDAFSSLAAEGGILRANGRAIAFFLGERQNDTLFLHIEKGLREVRGAYPMLVRCVADAFLSEAVYENREEDDGDEGLRQSKLSYRPCALLEKYRAVFGEGKISI